MIKVNLIIKPPPRFRWRVVAAAVGAAALLGGLVLGSVNWWVSYRLLGQEVANASGLLAQYRQAVKNADATAARAEAAKKGEGRLQAIRQGQTEPDSPAMKDVLATPSGVALTAVKVEGQVVTVQGEATSFANAMGYLATLQTRPTLAEVAAQSAKKAENGLTTFTITAKMGQGVKP